MSIRRKTCKSLPRQITIPSLHLSHLVVPFPRWLLLSYRNCRKSRLICLSAVNLPKTCIIDHHAPTAAVAATAVVSPGPTTVLYLWDTHTYMQRKEMKKGASKNNHVINKAAPVQWANISGFARSLETFGSREGDRFVLRLCVRLYIPSPDA